MIKECRKMKGLTQKELGDLCAYDQSYISILENFPGHYNLTLDSMINLALSLDIDYKDLILYLAECRFMEIFSKK